MNSPAENPSNRPAAPGVRPSLLCARTSQPRGQARRARRAGASLLAALLGLIGGCSVAPPASDQVTGPSYTPSNIHAAVATLPTELRRVACLPLVPGDASAQYESGRDALEPILFEELRKTQRFELVKVSKDQLRSWTGRWDWTSQAQLPPQFFETLRRETACDGVLFCRLTQFTAHPPLVVGWHLALIECPSQRMLWVADEVFDAHQPEVVAGARRYFKSQPQAKPALADSWSILNSPRQFAHYAAATLLARLPGR